MQLSFFLAKLLGLYLVIVSVCMLNNAKRFRAFIVEISNDHAAIILSGLLSLIFGLAISIAHNVWTGWPVIITLIGWLAVLKGVLRLSFTDWTAKYIRKFSGERAYFSVTGISLFLGLVLLYFGFMA